MEKKQRTIPAIIGGGLLCLLINAVNVGVLLSADTMIIHFGAKGYKTLQGFAGGTAILATALYVFLIARYVIKNSRNKNKEENTEEKPQSGMLSASGKLSDEYVMNQLVNQGLTKWKCIEGDVSRLTDQLILMNSYQDRLSNLLANNSAEALSDTEDILERMEQQILSNVRKVLNFMEILGLDDKKTVSEYIGVCVQDNQKLLDATKDFLLCVTGFLNGQGTSGENDLRMVEDFKAILSGNIETEEKAQMTLKE